MVCAGNVHASENETIGAICYTAQRTLIVYATYCSPLARLVLVAYANLGNRELYGHTTILHALYVSYTVC